MSDKNLKKPSDKDETQRKQDRLAMRWLGFGMEFTGVMGIFSYFGYVADKKFNTGPWLMVTGLMIGFIGMMYLLFKETEQWRK